MGDSYRDSIQDYNRNVNDTNTDSITDFNWINDTANFNNSTILSPEIGDSIRIMQLNIEGISTPKCEFLENSLHDEKIDIVALQETHITQEGPRSAVRGYTMVGALHHDKFGIATYVKDELLPASQVLPPINPFSVGIKINGITIVNVYKPPSAQFEQNVLPRLENPSIVLGDFNSHHTLWGYDDIDQDGTNLTNWMTREDFSLLHSASDPGTFFSRRWNRSYSPDLCFLSKDSNGETIPATRRILKGFPNSQHRPIIINVGMQMPLIRADKNNKWNFNKANWEKFSQLIDQTAQRIPAYPHNYDRFVGLIKAAAKKSIPRGHRDAYVPGWTEDSKALYDQFRASGNADIGQQLLRKLDENRRKSWETKLESLSFTKSTRKAWNTLNRLNGKSFRTKKIYPVTADEVAAKIMQNSKGRVPENQKKSVNRKFIQNLRNCRSSDLASPSFTSSEVT